jgi:ABC-type branched-subunit amino acid transport system substrate-binding protein
MLRSRRIRVLLLAIVAVVVATSAYGWSAGAKTKKPTGTPITIWTMSAVGNPVANVPQVFAGVKAGARAINARGGIHGHPIVVKTCNGQFNPNQELACARDAVNDHAVAMVGSLAFVNAAGVQAVLKSGNVANVQTPMSTPQDFANPINFSVTSGNFAMSACAALVPRASGAKKVGIAAINFPSTLAGAAQAGEAAKKHGAEFKGTVSFPLTTSDLGPTVKQVQQTGANMVILAMQPQIIGQFISTAAGQGNNWTYCGQGGTIYYQTLAQLGSAASRVYASAVYPPLQDSAKYPLLQRFKREMNAEKAAGDKAADLKPSNLPESALDPWIGTQILEQVGKSMRGTINNVTFLKALNKAKVDFGNLLPAVNFAKPNPNPAYRRLFNTRVFIVKWDTSAKRWRIVTSVKPTAGDKL